MPRFIEHFHELNARFAKERIGELLVEIERFAPGATRDGALMIDPKTPLGRAFRMFLSKMPASFHEAINGVVRSALATKPPTPITFAWAPGYDYELTLWQPECGITLLIRTPYPAGEAD